MSDAMIVPINPPNTHEQVAESLVLARAENLALFHTWEAHEMEDWGREQYLIAQREDLVMALNMVIRKFGAVENGCCRFTLESKDLRIHAAYSELDGTTEIVVNDSVALTNKTPRKELFIA